MGRGFHLGEGEDMAFGVVQTRPLEMEGSVLVLIEFDRERRERRKGTCSLMLMFESLGVHIMAPVVVDAVINVIK